MATAMARCPRPQHLHHSGLGEVYNNRRGQRGTGVGEPVYFRLPEQEHNLRKPVRRHS